MSIIKGNSLLIKNIYIIDNCDKMSVMNYNKYIYLQRNRAEVREYFLVERSQIDY
jgi:hypothetical protein